MDELTVDNIPSRNVAVSTISGLDPEKKWLVKIYPWSPRKSEKQNRLLWKWNNEFGAHYGWTGEEAHFYFKERFLIGIYYRDDPEFVKMSTAMLALGEHDKKNYEIARAGVIKWVSTTKLTQKQMAEYLTNIQLHCHHEQVPITMPPDKEFRWLCNIPKTKD